ADIDRHPRRRRVQDHAAQRRAGDGRGAAEVPHVQLRNPPGRPPALQLLHPLSPVVVGGAQPPVAAPGAAPSPAPVAPSPRAPPGTALSPAHAPPPVPGAWITPRRPAPDPRPALAAAPARPTAASATSGSTRRTPICTRQVSVNSSRTAAAAQAQLRRAD